MRIRRAAAYRAADDSIAPLDETVLAGPVPVWGSLKAGWVFFFVKFRQIAMRLWLTAIILAIIEYLTRLATASPDLLTSLAYLFLYFFAFANLYALALGGALQRPVIAGFAIGPDELRFFLTTVIYLVIVFIMLKGAQLIGKELADQVGGISGDIAKLSNPTSVDDVRWFTELPVVQQVVYAAPICLAGVVLLWFSTRYVFVPLHVIAVRKLAIFDAMALTKGNSWRLLLLMVALTFILLGVGWAIQNAVTFIEQLMVEAAQNAIHSSGAVIAGHHSLFKPAAIRPVPQWIGPVVVTFTDLMAVAVIVGTLSFAYRKATNA